MLGKLSKNWEVSKVRVHCNFFSHAIACVQHMTSHPPPRWVQTLLKTPIDDFVKLIPTRPT